MNSVTFGNSKIRYTVKKSSKRKTIQIVVDKSGVHVTSPQVNNHQEIKKIVKSHSKWIYKKQLRVKEEKIEKVTYLNGSRLPYLGKNHLLQVMEVKGKESFVMRNGKFIARINYASKSKIRRLYTEWSNLKAIPILEKSVKKYSKKIKVETGKISIKHQESRWGSLSKKGTLNFNQNLIRAPPKIVDYVAAHEVCHFKIPNHSRSYWMLLSSIMPDYKERKDWLRVNRSLLTK